MARQTGELAADPLDLMCHLAFNEPLRTRRERADRLLKDRIDYFDQYGPDARSILEALLERYAEYGFEQLKMPDALKLPPLNKRGSTREIIQLFGGVDKLRAAVDDLQAELYAAA